MESARLRWMESAGRNFSLQPERERDQPTFCILRKRPLVKIKSVSGRGWNAQLAGIQPPWIHYSNCRSKCFWTSKFFQKNWKIKKNVDVLWKSELMCIKEFVRCRDGLPDLEISLKVLARGWHLYLAAVLRKLCKKWKSLGQIFKLSQECAPRHTPN
jgi:hypothetical protein